MKQDLYKINARKINGEIYRSWRAELINETPDYLLFLGTFEKEVVHNDLGVIRRGTLSYEYYWKNRWFNVFRFHEPEGNFRNFYCNINQPPVFSGKVLDYIDLDIDLIVESDYSYRILDLDDYEINAQLLNYSPLIRRNAKQSVSDLIELIETRQFPFDYLKQIN